MNIKWDAATYQSDFAFVPDFGQSLIQLIDPAEAKTVLDLGCGTGQLTSELAKAGFRVIGLDESEDQLEIARKNYPDLIFLRGDALSFQLEEPVDVIFSNAVFHWIDRRDQGSLLKNLYRALKPDGQLVFEMGGKGNTAKIHAALAEAFGKFSHDYEVPFYFPSIGEYTPLLEEAGFRVEYAYWFERPTRLQGEDGMEKWIRLFDRKPFQNIRESDVIIREAVQTLKPSLYQDPDWFADYVRLRIKAKKEG